MFLVLARLRQGRPLRRGIKGEWVAGPQKPGGEWVAGPQKPEGNGSRVIG